MGIKVYAEGFGIICGLADMKIDFQSVDPVVDQNGNVSETKTTEARISLSLPLAKDLTKRLCNAIADYERKFGQILDIEEVQNRNNAENQ